MVEELEPPIIKSFVAFEVDGVFVEELAFLATPPFIDIADLSAATASLGFDKTLKKLN